MLPPQCTFPKRLEDTPAYYNWPGENLEVVYGEGLHIGYRHYERAKIEPLFPFGHGLSYTSFEYGRPALSSKILTESRPLELIVAVSNVGSTVGYETVQVYVHDDKSRLPRPEKELVAFDKVLLRAGETRYLRVEVDKHAVGYYDTSLNSWIAEEGRFDVLVGASSADIRLVALRFSPFPLKFDPPPLPCPFPSLLFLVLTICYTIDRRHHSTWRNHLPGLFKEIGTMAWPCCSFDSRIPPFLPFFLAPV